MPLTTLNSHNLTINIHQTTVGIKTKEPLTNFNVGTRDMNIFNSLRKYAGKWSVIASRAFSDEEQSAITSATVVPSQYGNSVCFMMVGGGQTFIPLSTNSSKAVGDTIDLSKAKLLTLAKDGEEDIYRVEA